MKLVKERRGIFIECGPKNVLSGLAKSNGVDNIYSTSSENFYDEIKKIPMTRENIFVSGASRGIGKEMAINFAKKGFNVVGTSRSDFDFNS